MTDLRTAAQQALEYLDAPSAKLWPAGTQHRIITALRAALAEPVQEPNRAQKMRDAGYTRRPTLREMAEPVQEPVAWMCADESMVQKGYSRFSRTCNGEWRIPVYTAPTPRTPLSEEEIAVMRTSIPKTVPFLEALVLYTRAVERKHGIGDKDE